MTPPSRNPFWGIAKNAKIWRNPEEIKPGVWLVEECSGPKATTVNMIVIKPSANRAGWRYVATVNRPRYGTVTLNLTAEMYRWKITAPVREAGKLVAHMIELVKEHVH